MSIKSDRWIRRMAENHGMIEPFEPGQVKEVAGRRIVSYGTSSYGYDLRCSNEFKLFTDINCTIVDPKELRLRSPSSMSRATTASSRRTRSRSHGPSNTSAFRATSSCSASASRPTRAAASSSTSRRLEPEWEGHVTLEFSNTTPLPAKIYANEGVAQVIFLEAAADDICETSYRDRGGKYQGQRGVTLPKI